MSTAGELVAQHTRAVPDFPSPGIVFRDLGPLFAHPEAFGAVLAEIAGAHRGRVDLVCGVEARGFVVGAPLARELGVGFVPVRKAGKLPGEVLREDYALEYGTASVEVQADTFTGAPRVLLVDDVLATGGTAAAAARLLERAGARVVALEVLVELEGLGGRAALGDLPVRSCLVV